MADRALFVGFGVPVRGREERAIAVFNDFVAMFGRMQSDGRIEGVDITLLDAHGGDLGGFFLVQGSADQCAALQNDEEFRMLRNESFQDHWGSPPMTADSWANRITNRTFQPEISFLVRDVANGAPAGMLVTLSWEADTVATGVRDAYFMLIGTLRDYRKRGIASALIGYALRAAADQGYDRASLTVDSENASGAFGIYEKAGFTPTKRSARWTIEG